VENEVNNLQTQALGEIEQAASRDALEALRIKYLGRKSEVNALFAKIPTLAPEERGAFGRSLNQLKNTITQELETKLATFCEQEELVDLTRPAQKIKPGTKHVLSYVCEDICRIFEELGFVVQEGNEIENEWHNFSALNIPLDHPSRDDFDTFYLDLKEKKEGKFLLRSHTSPSQIRVMKNNHPPLAVISPGRVYRPDKVDASHSFMFHQLEGFCVDKDISFANLKGVLLGFARKFFSPEVKLRLRPSFFPFTEPSAEVDVSCVMCKQKGCSVCKQSGWIEVLGCGMIHPHVLESCGIDSKIYQGFAFGLGVDRMAMTKYQINDIRLFYENDVRFLEQFNEG
jgi:phenylalanyl-tRNA synthetase alpha chain